MSAEILNRVSDLRTRVAQLESLVASLQQQVDSLTVTRSPPGSILDTAVRAASARPKHG